MPLYLTEKRNIGETAGKLEGKCREVASNTADIFRERLIQTIREEFFKTDGAGIGKFVQLILREISNNPSINF